MVEFYFKGIPVYLPWSSYLFVNSAKGYKRVTIKAMTNRISSTVHAMTNGISPTEPSALRLLILYVNADV